MKSYGTSQRVIRRLVLVDRKSGRVCGDTSAPGLYARVWGAIAAEFDDDAAVLASSAARFVDQSSGGMAREYVFATLAADRDSDGYLVFDCSGSGDGSPSIASEMLEPYETIYSVMTSCIYVGYVRRDH